MTTSPTPVSPRISLVAFCGAIVAIWAAATLLAFPLAKLLRAIAVARVNDWGWLPLVLFGFAMFYWLASARWPSSSYVSRFGFALGASAINCVLAINMFFAIGTIIFHG